jgi:hypothetical protein
MQIGAEGLREIPDMLEPERWKESEKKRKKKEKKKKKLQIFLAGNLGWCGSRMHDMQS